MLDLQASARRLVRRLMHRRPDPGSADQGISLEADGVSAVAAVEAMICDPAGADAGRRGSGGRGRLAAAVGLASAGRRASATLSGAELAACVDLLAQAAGRRLPLVVHLVSQGESCGHEGAHAAATTGAVVLFAANVQDAVDLTLLARRLAEDALGPVVVAMDGPETAFSVQDLRLPSPGAVERFLGRPEAPVHPPTASQTMLFGPHRRRLPRWHDAQRPLLHGAGLGAEVFGLAAVARRAYFDVDLPQLLARATEDFARELGRRPEALSTHRVDGARFLVVAQGAAVEAAQAAVDRLRGEGVKAGGVGLRRLRPLPDKDLGELLRGRRGVVVLERVEAPLRSEGPLVSEIRSLSAGETGPRLISAFYGLGGRPLRPADLVALVHQLAARGEDPPSTLTLGVDATAAAAGYPKRQALHDALRRGYPGAARLGVRAAAGGPERPLEGALTVSVHRFAGGDGFAREAASMLHRLLGGTLRSRLAPDPRRWGTERVDVVSLSPSSLGDPGDDPHAGVAVWLGANATSRTLGKRLADGGRVLLPGGSRPAGLHRLVEDRRLVVYAVDGEAEEHLLGALAGLLGMEGRGEISLRKLLSIRRGMLEEHGADDLEQKLDELQSGFERVQRLSAEVLGDDLEPVDASGEGPSPAVRRLGRSATPLADLPGFWDRAGVLYRDGATAELSPDPFLATAALPPCSAAMRDLSPLRTLLPAFDPELCTGCGACWTSCPDAAVGPAVIAPAALLEHAMKHAREGGADKLRMVAGKLASRVARQASAGWSGGPAGPLFDDALEATLETTKLPAQRQADVRAAYAAARAAIAELPLARTAPFFDQAAGEGELLTLAIDPDACKGCGLCVAACEPKALTAVADSQQRTAAARALWRLCEELPDPGDATLERARAHPDVGLPAGALLSRRARQVMTGGHGAEPGSGEALALRQILGVAAYHLQPIFGAQLAQIRELRARLAETLHESLARALPDRDLDALALGLDGLAGSDAELAELTHRVETAFESERVDVVRSRRLVAAARALADLEWRFVTGEGGLGRSPMGIVLDCSVRDGAGISWAGAFPHNPFKVPVTVDGTGEVVDLARGLLAGRRHDAVEVARVLRRARLELDSPAAAARAAAELDELTWQDLTGEEQRTCPPLFAVTTDEALGNLRLGSLQAAEALPLKLVVLSGLPAEEGAGRDVAQLLGTRPETSCLQTSVADFDHLEKAVVAALAKGGPALLRVLAPTPSRGGFASDATLERARELVDAGAFAMLGVEREAPAVAPVPGAATGSELAAVTALKQQHAAELAALRRQLEGRFAAQQASFQAATARRIRDRLMVLATGARGIGERQGGSDSAEGGV